MAKTPKDFYEKYNGKRIDDDGAYGVQCVDAFRVLCRYLGIPVKPTPNNWADGYWYYRNALGYATYFDYITNKKYQNGDVVIWARGSSHPSSHVAMYYNGQEFGQNQGGDRGFCLKSTNFNDALGALRPKVWAVPSLDKYTDEQLADMVLEGKFGNGDDRKKALGARYSAVQKIVDNRLKKKKSNEEIAQEVLDGKWGNGEDRKNKLTKAGYDYSAIQKIVDELCKKKNRYAPSLPFTQADTNKIVNAHRYDFSYKDFDAFLKKQGGYNKYVKSLGGVFTKWADRNKTAKVTFESKTAKEFGEACDFVMGLLTIYGVNYTDKNGKKVWGSSAGNYADDAFYNSSVNMSQFFTGDTNKNGFDVSVDEILSGKTKGGMMVNCGWGVTYMFRKAGLIPKGAENIEVEFYGDKDYHKYYRKRGAKMYAPKTTKDIQVGDIIGFYGAGTGFTYKHCCVVVDVNKSKGTYTIFDTGSARFTKTRGCNVTGKIGDSPLYGSYKSWKLLRLPVDWCPVSFWTDEQLADRVLAGKYGNGDARKKALGSRYSAVQSIINKRYAK